MQNKDRNLTIENNSQQLVDPGKKFHSAAHGNARISGQAGRLFEEISCTLPGLFKKSNGKPVPVGLIRGYPYRIQQNNHLAIHGYQQSNRVDGKEK